MAHSTTPSPQPATRTAPTTAMALVLATSCMAGCHGDTASEAGAGDTAALAFETALAGDGSAITAAETVVVRDAAQWNALWQRHAAYMMPLPAAPARDFSGRQMVGVFVGSRPDGCHTVQVTAVSRSLQAVVVRYREQRTGRGDACTQAITQPHHLVWIPASDLPVTFSRQ